jgi:uncharacterized protein with HEPN domain
VDFEAFEKDRMRVRAVERMLEIIGEAARGLSSGLPSAMSVRTA